MPLMIRPQDVAIDNLSRLVPRHGQRFSTLGTDSPVLPLNWPAA